LWKGEFDLEVAKMIFAHTLENVLASKKTQTRRLVKPGETLHCVRTLLGDVATVHIPGKRKIYEVGKAYAVQPGRGKKAVAYIQITGLRKERVQDVTRKDARAEGFRSRREFLETWQQIHGKKADLSAEVWVICFELKSIVANEFKTIYERKLPQHEGVDHRHDLPAPLAEVPRTGMHGGNHREGRVGASLSHELQVSAGGKSVSKVPVDSDRTVQSGRGKRQAKGKSKT